ALSEVRDTSRHPLSRTRIQRRPRPHHAPALARRRQASRCRGTEFDGVASCAPSQTAACLRWFLDVGRVMGPRHSNRRHSNIESVNMLINHFPTVFGILVVLAALAT